MSGFVALDGPDGGDGDTPPPRHPYRRRHVRQTLTFLALVALVLGSGFIGYLVWSGSLDLGSSGRPTALPCPTPTQTAASSASTRVRVYNGSGRKGLAGAVARELQLRGFRVPDIANAPGDLTVAGAVQLRYGGEGTLHARTVAAQFNGEVELVVDPAITDDAVNLYLGPKFAEMRTVPDALTLLTPAPGPSPAGCAPDTSTTPRPLVNDPRPPQPVASATT